MFLKITRIFITVDDVAAIALFILFRFKEAFYRRAPFQLIWCCLILIFQFTHHWNGYWRLTTRLPRANRIHSLYRRMESSYLASTSACGTCNAFCVLFPSFFPHSAVEFMMGLLLSRHDLIPTTTAYKLPPDHTINMHINTVVPSQSNAFAL